MRRIFGARWLRLGLAIVAFLVAMACSDDAASPPPSVSLGEPDTSVEVTMRDIAFEDERIEIDANAVVEFQLRNRGNLVHDFTIDTVPVELEVVEPGGRIGSPRSDLYIHLDSRRSAAVRLRVSAPGEYVFYCSVPGHRQAGMEGILVVR